jgi:hypothetical protein
MTDVWSYSLAAGTDLLVLIALADIADDNGECWPSLGYLARKCRVDIRTVRRRIRSLEKLGEVVVLVGGGAASTPGGTRSNRYQITVHMPEEEGSGDLTDQDTGDRGGRSLVSGGGRSLVSAYTSNRYINESKTRGDLENEFADLWNLYPRKVDRAKVLKAYAAQRKAGVSADDLMAAAVHYAEAMATVEARLSSTARPSSVRTSRSRTLSMAFLPAPRCLTDGASRWPTSTWFSPRCRNCSEGRGSQAGHGSAGGTVAVAADDARGGHGLGR